MTDPPDAVGRRTLVALSLSAAATTFLYRFLTPEFTNDHFVHLSRAWQILRGDVPVRDFFDPGLILQYYTSAAALLLSGHNLLGETIVTAFFFAAGAGLTAIVSARLSGSAWIAAATTAVVVMATPRLYNYPKAFLYVLALAAAWHWADRPTTRRLVGLAAITVLAFLFRYDHGAYIAASVFVLVGIRHRGNARLAAGTMLRYAATGLAMVLPLLVFLQATVGLARHVRGISPQIGQAISLRVDWVSPTFDASQPLVVVRPAAERRVNVRWAEDVTESERGLGETTHGLTRPAQVGDSTWSYVLADEGRDRVGRLLDDPAVADTHGIDRAARVVDIDEPRHALLERWIPLLRTELAPGVFSARNALAWTYAATLLVPLAGLLLLVVLLYRGRLAGTEAAVAGMAVVLGVIVVQTIVRNDPDTRVVDVSTPVAIVGAWIAGRLVRRGRAGACGSRRRGRAGRSRPGA